MDAAGHPQSGREHGAEIRKLILSLTNSDYNDNALSDLLRKKGDAYGDQSPGILSAVTATGWPGGKPNVDNATHAECSKPYPKRVLIFSPHSLMTISSPYGVMCLYDQGHEVYAAHQTLRNIAVTMNLVTRFPDFASWFQAAGRYRQ